jgi:hypothetical protein
MAVQAGRNFFLSFRVFSSYSSFSVVRLAATTEEDKEEKKMIKGYVLSVSRVRPLFARLLDKMRIEKACFPVIEAFEKRNAAHEDFSIAIVHAVQGTAAGE